MRSWWPIVNSGGSHRRTERDPDPPIVHWLPESPAASFAQVWANQGGTIVKSQNLCMSCSALIVALGCSDKLSAIRDSIRQYCWLHCRPAARLQETNRDAVLPHPDKTTGSVSMTHRPPSIQPRWGMIWGESPQASGGMVEIEQKTGTSGESTRAPRHDQVR
jgi:hypothetical protein